MPNYLILPCNTYKIFTDYGHPDSFFSKILNFWAWADKLGRIFLRHMGYFWPNYKHYFGTVSPLSMGKCSWFSKGVELVSKELNHFGVIAGLFRQIGCHSSRFVLFCSFWRLFTIKMIKSVKVFPFCFWKMITKKNILLHKIQTPGINIQNGR